MSYRGELSRLTNGRPFASGALFLPVLSVDVRSSCALFSLHDIDKILSQNDEILKTLQLYIDGSKQGKSELMRPAFHPQASFFGNAGDQLAVGTEL